MSETPLRTFRESVAHIEKLCHTVLANYGGEPCEVVDPTRKGTYYVGGYRFPTPVPAGSEADYALKILLALKRAGDSTDREQA